MWCFAGPCWSLVVLDLVQLSEAIWGASRLGFWAVILGLPLVPGLCGLSLWTQSDQTPAIPAAVGWKRGLARCIVTVQLLSVWTFLRFPPCCWWGVRAVQRPSRKPLRNTMPMKMRSMNINMWWCCCWWLCWWSNWTMSVALVPRIIASSKASWAASRLGSWCRQARRAWPADLPWRWVTSSSPTWWLTWTGRWETPPP